MPADAVVRALRHVWLSLKPLDVPVAVMGGIALAAWKYIRATQDVDLLLGIEQHDPNQLLQTLRAAGIRAKRDPPVTTLGQLEMIQLVYEPPETYVDLQIDLFLAKSRYHDEALRRRVPMQLENLDVEIAVLACEDLILHKLLAGRIIDRADAAALLRANRAALDIGYLLRWVGHLELKTEFTETWGEAFPGESLPVQ